MTVISRTTLALIDALTHFSGNKIARPHDFGILLEIGCREENHILLDELSFLAKFVRRAHAIMQRIGTDGEGYDKVSAEFTVNLERAKDRLRNLMQSGSDEEARRLEKEYLELSQGSFSNLMMLLYDLEWYKNWRIDQKNH